MDWISFIFPGPSGQFIKCNIKVISDIHQTVDVRQCDAALVGGYCLPAYVQTVGKRVLF